MKNLPFQQATESLLNRIQQTDSGQIQSNRSYPSSQSRVTIFDGKTEDEQLHLFGQVAARWCNNRYNIDESNYHAIKVVINYITREKPMDGGLKGIMLFGDRGTGKTVIMKTMNALMPDEDKFTFVNVPQLAGYYSQKGDEIFDKFNRTTDGNWVMNQQSKLNHICLNDLGREKMESMWMGNKEDVGSMLIYLRYDLFQDRRVITHGTSNFQNLDECAERYGDLNADRSIVTGKQIGRAHV